jgi:4-aminobutyrate aminotransferase / (S)-3-amino-2-methylpropionate transaminase
MRLDSRLVRGVVDYTKSKGSWLMINGKKYLDMVSQIASCPLGPNHPEILKVTNSSEAAAYSTLRVVEQIYPSKFWNENVERVLGSVAPKGLENVHTACGCGSGAIEGAMRLAFMAFRRRENSPYTPLVSASFDRAFHGRTVGAGNLTRCAPVAGIPLTEDWISLPFPNLRYPLEQHANANSLEEGRCLELADAAMFNSAKAGKPIASVFAEPILCEGGEKHASDEFWRTFRNIVRSHNSFFIADEIQTGLMRTGTFWKHQQWDGNPPDAVVFSKSMQLSGIYYSDELIPESPVIRGTWHGDTWRLMILEAILDVVKSAPDLQSNIIKTGNSLAEYLKLTNARNVRVSGNMVGFEVPSGYTSKEFIDAAYDAGVLLLSCTSTPGTVRIRPQLFAGQEEVEEFKKRMNNVLYSC